MSKRKSDTTTTNDDASAPNGEAPLGSSSEHDASPGGDAASSSSSSPDPTSAPLPDIEPDADGIVRQQRTAEGLPEEPTNEELDRAAKVLIEEGAESGSLTLDQVQSRALELRDKPVEPKSGEATPTPPDGGKGPPESPAPPLASEFVAKAQDAEVDEREDWGDRPTLGELEDAYKIQVRTVDPRAGDTPVAGGVIATSAGVDVLVHSVRDRGASYLPALAHDERVQIRIVD